MIDVAPTVLEAAGLPEPTVVHGVEQKPYEGVSMRYAFDDAGAAERHVTQYFEMFCNRGIYHEGWTAVTRHSTPWIQGIPLPPFADDTWELYDTNTDWSQAHDLAAQMPDKLDELKALFMDEARKYNVLPLDDRRIERFNSDLAGRPTLVKGNSQLLFGGMGRLSENVVLNVKNKSHAVTAEVTIPDGGAEGVIIAQGGQFAGWSLYLKAGTPTYAYNLLGVQHFDIASDDARPGPAPTRSAWSSPTTAADSARAPTSPSTSTAPRPARAASTRPSRSPSPATRPATSAPTPPHPSATNTPPRPAASPAPSNGCSSTSTTPPKTSTT